MNLNEVKKQIQDFFQEGTVTVVGSGLSVAEGLPGMDNLAAELCDKMPRVLSDATDIDLWNQVQDQLNIKVGLEKALHTVKPSDFMEDCIREVTANLVGAAEMSVFQEIIARKKTLRFTNYISRFNIRTSGHTVITTNYDRMVECACEMAGLRVDTLFLGRYLARFEPEQSKYVHCKGYGKRKGYLFLEYWPRVTVLKPHGCLSWHLIDGVPYSIPYAATGCPLIITPGINKYLEGYGIPFDKHRSMANDAIDCATRLVIIGYGFGDEHLETHLIPQLKKGTPALLLTKDLTPKIVSIIAESAHMMAICSDGATGSNVKTQTENLSFPDINLWDIDAMLKEVF